MLLTGVPVAFALGVPGSDLNVGVGLEAVAFVEGVALAATLGVMGVRAVRFDSTVGFSGRVVLRSLDIATIAQSLQHQLSLHREGLRSC
jgi:hypothetical protein